MKSLDVGEARAYLATHPPRMRLTSNMQGQSSTPFTTGGRHAHSHHPRRRHNEADTGFSMTCRGSRLSPSSPSSPSSLYHRSLRMFVTTSTASNNILISHYAWVSSKLETPLTQMLNPFQTSTDVRLNFRPGTMIRTTRARMLSRILLPSGGPVPGRILYEVQRTWRVVHPLGSVRQIRASIDLLADSYIMAKPLGGWHHTLSLPPLHITPRTKFQGHQAP